MTLRAAVKSDKLKEKEFYDRSRLPPYFTLATQPTSSAALNDVLDRGESYLNDVAGEADVAAGSMMTRVRSFGCLRSPPPQPVPEPATQVPRSESKPKIQPSWFLKDKMRTAGVGLVMALNIGTDPPDITKPHPCAKLQTWMDPTSVSRAKAKEKIGERLQAQYAQWQQQRTAIPVKYRRALDPTIEDVRALCLWLRRQARTDRILFHYNGHGVPRPTSEGELWLFDKNHTQYIPLCVTDLRQYMGKPNIVILDCSSAGVLMPFLTAPLEASNGTPEETPPSTRPSTPSPPSRTSDMEAAASQMVSDTIVLCATSENEWLPMHPDYPADIFTSCLTTPIQMALRWFVRCNPQSMDGLLPEAVDAIPGKSIDRKTPLGELTWIFAAVTDSIAWNVLPRPLFQRLFRQDLLVAGMFRNFLLADRILRSLNCSPQSYPPLPPGVCDHPLWEAWDLACETCLYGLIRDGILTNRVVAPVRDSSKSDDEESSDNAPSGTSPPTKPIATGPASSVSSPFFSEQLSAFEIWLDFASIHKASPGRSDTFEPFESPEQLPTVLQVLLTPAYRIRALILLRRFLDLGPWAVNLALSLGILPYVTKLLQSPECKQDLMGIWAKILAFDPSCQHFVLKDGGLPHFISHLTWGINTALIAIPVDPKEAAAQRTMAAFILAATCLGFPRAQAECIRLNLHGTCCSLLSTLELGSGAGLDPDFEAKLSIAESRVPPFFRTWLCLCLGSLVKDNALVQSQALGAGVHRRLLARISDDNPDVRAAACYALGCILGSSRQSGRSDQDVASSSAGVSQQQPSASFAVVGGSTQPSLIPNRLMGPPNQLVGAAGISGRLQPTFNSGPPGSQTLQRMPQGPMGMVPQQPIQLPQVQPHLQQMGYNPDMVSPAPIGGSGMGMLPTTFGGRPMDGSYLGRPQSSLMSPQFTHSPNEPRLQVRSAFEDESRIAHDTSVTNGLLKAAEDASAMVRYEAVISLARVVEKYLSAFVTLADSHKTGPGAQDQEQDSLVKIGGAKLDTSDKRAPKGAESARESDAVRMSHGVEDAKTASFTKAWNVLRHLKRHDPYPDVSSVANSVVSVVHEQILSANRQSTTSLRSLLSSPSISHQLQQNLGQTDHGNDDEKSRTSEAMDTNNPLRRISSESAESSGWGHKSKTRFAFDRPENLMSKSDGKASSHDFHFILGNDLPVSKFYEWQKDSFAEIDTTVSNVDDDQFDPLSFEGAVKSYREQRNRHVHEISKKDADHFASLAPKPPKTKKKQRFNVDLFEEDEEAANIANTESAKKKRELELKQTFCLTNEGADMRSCLLRFHSYEDALLVCDGHEGVSLWDSHKNEWLSRFRNGNPIGSRMTSTCFINERSNSLFVVGCDDGSVRVWDGLIEPNGDMSSKSPALSAAFFAAPDMIAGGDSGLKLEWQQYSGRLIAGGNCDSIRCWDLGAEKCVSVLKTESEACVTTISTAWDYDPYGPFTTEGFHGIGPDIIVVGHGDGSMRLFDIRANRPAAETKSSGSGNEGRASRQPRMMKYDEHSNWIVSACLTSYGGRPEVVSGSVDGEIKMWDLRLSSSLRTYKAQRRKMTALSVHQRIPLVATGSHEQFIKVMTLDGYNLQVIRYHDALDRRQIGPVSCLEFHPHKPILAAGGTDSIVSIYSPKNFSTDR